MTSFHDIIHAGYSKGSEHKLKDEGFIMDQQLSDSNNKIYYNKDKKQLIHNVLGSHTTKDWFVHNPLIGVGIGFKNTNRYKDSHKKLREAKAKYNAPNATVIGHSQGGYTAGMISSKGDKVYTLNKAATIGQKVRGNETHYRTQDLVSLMNANSKHTVNLRSDARQTISAPLNIVNNHIVSAIQNKPIFV